ncbi:hypothetical protein H920_19065 [Fukomys damarensis]|uniref:Uncharacterized protein n=1 Tax=Fukomys damarensis TaxID=885580 RepID=A0A091CNH5_FUKDA|nr:hypothetical protein H920_19065 [Fukomys damarensis]
MKKKKKVEEEEEKEDEKEKSPSRHISGVTESQRGQQCADPSPLVSASPFNKPQRGPLSLLFTTDPSS